MIFRLKSKNPSHPRFDRDQDRKSRRKWRVLSGAGLAGLFFLFLFLILPPRTVSPPPCPPEPESSAAQEPQLQVIEGNVKEKSSLFKSLSEKRIPLQWIDLIISKLKPLVDFRRIKGGTYQFMTDIEGKLVKFVYEAGPTEVYEVEKDGQGYVAQKIEVPLDMYLVKVVGKIQSSLFEAMDTAGEEDQLTLSLAEILAWEIDFYKDVQPGDRFKLVAEKAYKGDQFIQYGPVHAVEYQRGEKTIRGVAYQEEFYNEQGISLKKAFLKTPLRFNRISSRFSQARKHPILGGTRPHYGVDYAAPAGTPIRAVADGAVVSCGWNGGFGKQVILRHRNGYTTYYGHLSGFGSGIKKGKKVAQKQVIGYVGSTGLSTGPHLDYRLAKDGRFKNPLKETFQGGDPIGKEEMEKFQKRRDEMMAWLQGEDPYRKEISNGEGGKE
jgi:murein DD-endopeptidase MepM/ murein hydrolase activator NlpD